MDGSRVRSSDTGMPTFFLSSIFLSEIFRCDLGVVADALSPEPTDSVTTAVLLPAADVSKNLQINARLGREQFRSLSH